MDFRLFIVIFIVIFPYKLIGGCRFGSDPDCAFPCNCRDGCNQDTGDCNGNGECLQSSPAETGWSGPGCRIGNVAYNKHMTQSSISGNHFARYGVDGETTGYYAHTLNESMSWLNVNLSRVYRIENVTVYDRPDASISWGGARLRGAKIQILEGTNIHECGEIPGDFYDEVKYPKNVITFSCSNMKGDSVRIYKEASAVLHICELVVIGYPYIANSWDTCSKWESDVVGCETCISGRRLPDCEDECSNGYYGVNCLNQCSDNCKPGTQMCNLENGMCKECKDWHLGEMCNTEIIELPIHNDEVFVTSTFDSITVKWSAARPPNHGTSNYYRYTISYRIRGGTYKDIPGIQLINDMASEQSHTISYLEHNTEYDYIVRSVRTVGELSHIYSANEMTVKTKCREPTIPTGLTIKADRNIFRIAWEGSLNRLDSGCDSMSSVTIEYKFLQDDDDWQSKAITDTQETEASFSAEGNTECWARMKLVNNANMESLTTTVTTVIIPLTPATPQPGEPDVTSTSASTKKTNQGAIKSTKDPPNVSMIAGVAVAAVVVVVLVVIIVLLFTRYRRSLPVFGKKKDKESKQKLSIDVKFETGKSVTPMGDVPIMPGPAPASSPKPKPISPRPQPAAKPVVQVNTSIPVSQLGSYIAKKRKERDGFKNEYSTLPEDETAPCERGSLPENKTKNRFLNIRAYDHSRVILETENNDPFSDYINCNYIPGFDGNKEHYIAGQGPKPHNIVDLWRMIWQKKINRIAMMTNEIENSRRKCDRYWPENVESSQQYGAITVTTMGIERFPFYTIRLLRVQKDGVSRSVRHFHFTAWIDKRIPEYAFPLLGFRKKVRMYDKQSTGPLFVHCSAGVGRTGTFIAIDYLLEQAKHKHTLDVRKWVNTMRGCRINMIQTLEQYIFVYDTLQEALACGDTSIPASELETTLKQLKVKQKGEKISPLEAQYKVIDDFRPVPKGEDFKALSEDNIHKNRDPNIYPSDLARPYLLTKSENGNDYINAVFVHGYNRSNHYLITQMPLPTTAVDFWRMVCDIDIVTIVALNEINDEDCTPYWPDENDSTETYGPIEVAFKSSQDDEIASVSTFEITNNENGGRKKEVEHIRMLNWPDNTLPDPKNLIHIVNLLEQRAQLHNEGNVVIHCLKGVSNSGILVAALNMIEKLKIDQEIDVFTAVKAIRINRNMFIESFEQYEYLYQVAQTYKAMNDTYANFS